MRTKTLIAAAGLLLLIAGCGGEAEDAGETATEAAEETAPAEETEVEAPAGGGDAVVIVGQTDLGEVLVDAEGRTLYLFTDDTGPESTCEADCAATWPPLVVEGEPSADAGVTAEVTTTERSDGSTQVVVADHPLYTFAGDSGPGDTSGQGVGGVWFAVTPDGEAVTADAGTEGAAGY